MVLAIETSKPIFRGDSSIFPLLTASGITDFGRIKVHDWHYIETENDTIVYIPTNETQFGAKIILKNVYSPEWTLSAGVNVHDDNSEIVNNGTEGWKGAYSDDTLSETACSIEAKITSLNLSSGISLQSGTVSHEFETSDVEHAIILGQAGVGKVLVQGAFKTHFPYFVGEKVMIELTDSLNGAIVRYWRIRTDDVPVLIWTTRSRLTAAPKPSVLVYLVSARLTDVRVFSNEQVQTTFDNIGVLSRFQEWEDDFQLVSNADSIQLADNSIVETFAASKTVLRTLNASRKTVAKDELNVFTEFFMRHRNGKDFIFVDYARKDEYSDTPTEFWARFVSTFGDKRRAGCLAMDNAQILESQRRDFIAKEIDIVMPTIHLAVPVLDLPTYIHATAGDNAKVKYVRFDIGDSQIGENIKDRTTANLFTSDAWDISTLDVGTYTLKATAYDYADNSATDTLTLTVSAVTEDGIPVTEDGEPVLDFEFS